MLVAIASGLLSGWIAKSVRASEWLSLAAALVFLGVAATEGQIANAVSVFGLVYAKVIAWTFQVAGLACAAALAIGQWRSHRWRALRPLAIGAVACLAWAVVPWADINLALVWHARHKGFEQVVTSVRSGQLAGHGLTTLPARYRSLSSNGEAWICASGDSVTVLFLTFSGILSHFSGFVYVDPDVPPSGQCFGADHLYVEKRAPNWYFLASD